MTREEAKDFLLVISYKLGSMDVEYLTEKDGEKMLEAIKALENNDVLDKIRAEIIERDRTVKTVRSDNCCFFTTEEVLKILDKYMSESEDNR